MFTPKRDTMHRSSRALVLFLAGSLLAGARLEAQAGQAASPSQAPAQIPVQDLTPPSDAELEKAALEAEKAAAEAAAAAKNDPAKAAASKSAPKDKFVFRQKVDEVMLYATVLDPENRLVMDLPKGAFTVYEDGKPQQITSFRREDIPVSVGLLIDNSGSMRQKRPAVNQAAINFVKASNKDDEVFIVNFDSEPTLDQDYTSDISKLKEALEQIQSRGGTALYDAVIASSDHLIKGARRDKKVLLLVTDGEDSASLKTLEQAVSAVQGENSPTLYTIGLLGDEGDRARRKAKRALERLAIETGGIAYFPSTLDEVDEISRAVAHDIRNQYAIGYKPDRPQSEGGFRNIRIEAKMKGHRLQVRTKSGYFAGQKQAANATTPASSETTK